MDNPTLERMEAWRDQATERLSLFARSNAIEEPIGIGEVDWLQCIRQSDEGRMT